MEDEEWEDVIVVSFVTSAANMCYALDEYDPGVKNVEGIKHPTLVTVMVSRPLTFADSDLQQSFTKSERKLYEALTDSDRIPKLGFLSRIALKRLPRAAIMGRTVQNEVHILDNCMQSLGSIRLEISDISAIVPWKDHIYCFGTSKVIKVCPYTFSVIQTLEEHEISSSSVTSMVYATPRGLFYISNYRKVQKLEEDLKVSELADLEMLNGLYVDPKKHDTWIGLQARGELVVNGEMKTKITPHDPEAGFFYSMNKAFSPYLILGEHQDNSQLNVLHAVRTSDLSRTSLLVLPEESSGVAVRSMVFFSPVRQLQYLACFDQGRGHLVYLNRGQLGLVGVVRVQGAPFRFCCCVLSGVLLGVDSLDNLGLFKLL